MRHTCMAVLLLAFLVFLAIPARASHQGICSNVTCQPGWSINPSNGIAEHAEVSLIFWQDAGYGGYQWSTGNSGGISQSIFIGEAMSLLASPYFGSLNWYGTSGGGFIAKPRLSPYGAIFTGVPNYCTQNYCSPSGTTTSTFVMGDIANVVGTGIQQAILPPPDQYDTSIYVVVLPNTSNGLPGGAPAGCVKQPGCNQEGQWSYNGVGYSLVYVVGTNAQPNGPEKTLSHELAESMSQYENIGVNGCGTANQIADLCNCYNGEPYGAYGTTYNNQFTVAYYYSEGVPQATGALCVAPPAPSAAAA
jgi:hypothetical protein